MMASDYQPRHPDDVYWSDVMHDLDNVDARPGPSSTQGEGQLIDISPSSDAPPIPPPRSRASSASHPTRPTTLHNISTSSSSPPHDDFVLVDVSPPGKKENEGRYSPEENTTALLMKDAEGYAIDENGKVVSVTLEYGTLLRPLTKRGPVATFLERQRRHHSELMFTDLINRNVALMERGSNVMHLADEYVMLLLPLTPHERVILYRDLETIHFVANLKRGDYVSVFNDPKTEMYQGKVIWKGEHTGHMGTWYEVEVNQANEPSHSMNVQDWGPPPPRTLYANAAHLHKPLKVYNDDYRSPQPEVRNIPIRRVETFFDADNSTHQQAYHGHDATDDAFARDVAFWDGDPRTVNEPMREWKERPRDESSRHERDRRSHHNTTSNGHHRNRHSQNGAQPSRSQSAHAVGVYDRTFSVDDPVRTNETRVGDRCVWNDGKMPHKGTIRFIGHLKGHTNLYAGVEFDDAVGKGTGTFQGEVVFQTAENRAGFVIFNTLEVLPRPPDSGDKPHFAVKHKQASAESLSDPPAPPPVPPRPIMRPEDYLIDAVSIGSYVEVCHLGACRSGVVRWVGDQMSEDHDRIEKSAIVELDEDVPSGWRLAASQPNSAPYIRGVLVPTSALRRDRRMDNGSSSNPHSLRQNGKTQDFGSIDSGVQETPCEPWKVTEDLIGRMKGIQGHRNSCYIDATLYAMFVQSTAFDSLLERPAKKHDIPQYKEFLKLLRTEIVYPLRKFHYVRADHVMKVRELLAEILPNMKGLTSEEKDPEEILGKLFRNVLKAEPFLQLRNLRDNKIDHEFLCPLVVEDWQGGVATTQHLLERSMRAAQVKFAVAPEILILQLPRYGQQKVFDKILPLQAIDITSLVHNATQPCSSCLKPADGMCPECFLCKRVFLSEVSYCTSCYKKVHYHKGESDHVMREFYPQAKPVKKISQHRMVLSAVLCIETSHYVAFVRCSTTGRWLFFDSMADREGLSDGFNVPQVQECDKMQWWLSPAGWHCLRDADQNGNTKTMLGKGSDVDPLVTRLLSDSYICFYQAEDAPTPPSTNLLNNIVQRIQKF